MFHRRYLIKILLLFTKPVLALDKPVYVRFSILDIRRSMNFITNTLKRKYDIKLLFTDTNSLVYEIETKGVYENFYGIKNLFDFSDYPRDSKFLDPVNEKINW